MPTEKQISANKVNAQKSTGPNTTTGKEASARNALKHGLSAKKYLTSSETPEEFAPLYAARRRLYPPNDPIIDRLVEKITLAHFRIDRGFEAEADILDQGIGGGAMLFADHLAQQAAQQADGGAVMDFGLFGHGFAGGRAAGSRLH